MGHHATRLIARHPDLELVGLWVHSDDKVGRDAGELVGIEPLGVAATNDVDALLALDADCVCYTATADLRPTEAIDDMARILASGANVVSSSVVPLLFPEHVEPAMRAPLEDACTTGGTSCFTSGIDPGFANDLLPLVLTGTSEYIESVRMMEIVNYATYAQPQVLFDTMGFGQALDATPLILIPGVLSFAWGGRGQGGGGRHRGRGERAAGGARTSTGDRHDRPRFRDRRRGHHRVRSGSRSRASSTASRGSCWSTSPGSTTALAPEWPHAIGSDGYRVIVTGNPSYTLDLQMMGDDGDPNTAGLVGTAGTDRQRHPRGLRGPTRTAVGPRPARSSVATDGWAARA